MNDDAVREAVGAADDTTIRRAVAAALEAAETFAGRVDVDRFLDALADARLMVVAEPDPDVFARGRSHADDCLFWNGEPCTCPDDMPIRWFIRTFQVPVPAVPRVRKT